MKLTEKELEVMDVLWESKIPMTVSDILEKTKGTRSWSSKSIYTLIGYLEKKGAIRVARSCPTNENYAKAYEATISCLEFMVKTAYGISKTRKHGVSADAYIEAIRNMWGNE